MSPSVPRAATTPLDTLFEEDVRLKDLNPAPYWPVVRLVLQTEKYDFVIFIYKHRAKYASLERLQSLKMLKSKKMKDKPKCNHKCENDHYQSCHP